MNSPFAVTTKSLSVFTMMSSISLVSTGNTPIQNTWFITKSVFDSSPTTRYLFLAKIMICRAISQIEV